jgi:hypothetical protein
MMQSVFVPPSPQSDSFMISRAVAIRRMPTISETEQEQNNIIKRLLIAHGERCAQCRHSIVVYHKDMRCSLCDCVRVVKEYKKAGMDISELFQMEMC